jgi:hypothetical protein
MASKIIVDQLEKTGGTLTALTLPVANASASEVLQNDGAGALSWAAFPASGSTIKVAYLVDQKTTGTSGGTFTSGAWQHRDLQTEHYDTIGITFGTNTFVMPVGTFYIDWSCPGVDCDQHKSRLYNITSAAVVKYGTSSVSKGNNAYGDAQNQTLSNGSALVTLAATATFKLEHQCTATIANGFGWAAGYSEVETYSTVKILQIA